MFVAFNFTNVYFLLDSWHHLYIFSYYHSFNSITSVANYMAKLLWEWNQGLPLRSWSVACWLWRHIPIVTSLAVPSSCVVTQTPVGTNSGTRRWKRKFPLLFVKLWSWQNRNWPLIRSALSWLVLQSGTALVVPAASGRATAGTTRAVPDCSTNHSSADRIVVNSYKTASFQKEAMCTQVALWFFMKWNLYREVPLFLRKTNRLNTQVEKSLLL